MTLRVEWHATNTLAGVISGAFFGGYLVAVPGAGEPDRSNSGAALKR